MAWNPETPANLEDCCALRAVSEISAATAETGQEPEPEPLRIGAGVMRAGDCGRHGLHGGGHGERGVPVESATKVGVGGGFGRGHVWGYRAGAVVLRAPRVELKGTKAQHSLGDFLRGLHEFCAAPERQGWEGLGGILEQSGKTGNDYQP
jgi:hypothetical protein